MILRRFTTDDLELVVELDSDPAVKRYIDGGLPVDRAEIQEMLDWWLGYYMRGDAYGFWAAIDRSSQEFLGWFHLRPDEGDAPDEPELGYRLRRAAWGRGLKSQCYPRLSGDTALRHSRGFLMTLQPEQGSLSSQESRFTKTEQGTPCGVPCFLL